MVYIQMWYIYYILTEVKLALRIACLAGALEAVVVAVIARAAISEVRVHGTVLGISAAVLDNVT